MEAAEELDEPLVRQGVRHEDEDAGGAAGEVEAVEDEPGLDGLAEADFICQQDARQEAGGDVGGDGHLVRDGIDPTTDEAAHGGGLHAAAPLDGFSTEGKGGQVVDAGREEALLGAAEGDGVGEFPFRDGLGSAVVNESAGGFRDGVDLQLRPVLQGDFVPCPEAGAMQRGAVTRVAAGLADGGEV